MNIHSLIETEQIIEIVQGLKALNMNLSLNSCLSVSDNAGNIWITPDELYPEILSEKDILFLSIEEEDESKKKPISSTFIHMHRAIYEKNMQARAIIQVNSPTITKLGDKLSYSMLSILPYQSMEIGTLSIENFGDFNKIGFITAISDHNIEEPASVLLKNFGMIVAAESLEKALIQIERIEVIAQALIQSDNCKRVKPLSIETIEFVKKSLPAEFVGLRGRKPHQDFSTFYQDIIHLTTAACNNHWIKAYGGSFSVKVDESTFFITNQNTSRQSSIANDFSVIKGDKVDAGKLPDKLVWIHQAIYAKNKNINCIAFIHPESLLCNILSGEKITFKKPNNSYRFNNKVPVLPYESLAKPTEIANEINLKHDGILIENFMYISADKTVLDLLNRLYSLVSLSRL